MENMKNNKDSQLEIALAINQSNLEKMDRLDQFVDFVYRVYPRIYNDAFDFIDDQEEELTENGYTADEVREYYLNSGFPRYNEEPFLSEYNDIDWIEHANESELEL